MFSCSAFGRRFSLSSHFIPFFYVSSLFRRKIFGIAANKIVVANFQYLTSILTSRWRNKNSHLCGIWTICVVILSESAHFQIEVVEAIAVMFTLPFGILKFKKSNIWILNCYYWKIPFLWGATLHYWTQNRLILDLELISISFLQ